MKTVQLSDIGNIQFNEQLIVSINSEVYIDPSAAVSGDGSFAAPLNSWSAIVFAENTVYRQKSGTTYNGIISINVSNVRIATYGGYAKALVNGTGKARCIEVWNGAYNVSVDNYDVYGANNRSINTVRGIAIGNSTANKANGCSVTNCIIRDIAYTTPTDDANGISVFGDDFNFHGNKVHNIATDGAWIDGHNLHASWNKIHDVAQDGRVAGDCMQLATAKCNDYDVHDNNFDHSSIEMKNCFIDGGPTTAGGIFYNNKCNMGTGVPTSESKAVNIQNVGAKAWRNEILNGVYGIFAGSVKLTDNTIAGQTKRGINIGSGSTAEVNSNVLRIQVDGIVVDTNATQADVLSNTIIDCTNGVVCNKVNALTNGITVERNSVVRPTGTAYGSFTAPGSNS
jgi:hypothetical protein